MANEKLIHAIDTFQAICGHLDAKGWHYQKDEEHLVINTTVSGDDLPMNLLIDVDEEQQRISIVSPLPLTFDEDKRVLAAVALAAVNDRLLNGAFDIELKTGKVFFKMSNSFLDCTVSDELMEYLIMLPLLTIDDFNDKLLMLSRGIIDINQFLESIKANN